MNTYTTSDFDYELPAELIAKQPLAQRTASRLLVVARQTADVTHRQFSHFLDTLSPQDLIVFNDTRVIPARLFGQKASGGKLECLVERILDSHQVLVHLRCSKAPAPGSELSLADGAIPARVLERVGALYKIEFCTDESVLPMLERHGELPLPPYFERAPEASDDDRYQTVFAKKPGAVAAPTASLHFDEALLAAIAAKGVDSAHITLHVGAGTFSPVRTENLNEHEMHSEYLEVSPEVCAKVSACKARGGRVFAIGTTVVRALETAAAEGSIAPYFGDTRLFITPGYRFRCVDAMVTNFHLPRSTLLMLVSAFAGFELTRRAYQEAIEQRYRFFSYGDAMVVL